MKKGLIFTVLSSLLVVLYFSISGCGTAVGLGLSAVKSGVELYKAGSGGGAEKSGKAKELQYDAATHRYYILDDDGHRVYE